MLSLARIICSVLLIVFVHNRIGFVTLYLVIGLTDILDGYIARKYNLQSELGAKLDSTADFIFYMILFGILINEYSSLLRFDFIVLIIGILFIRLSNMVLTKYKYNKFVFVHTIANKVSGVLVYFLPIILILSQNSLIILILLALVLMAAVEELLITIRYQEVNLNRTSLFSKNKHNGE